MSDQSEPVESSATLRIRPAGPDPLEERGRKRDLLAEQQQAWASDRPSPPEDYLARWPTDPSQDADAASLLVAEFFERRDRGERPGVEEYERRFPEHGPTLVNLIRRQEIFRSLGGKRPQEDRLLRLPDVGEEVFGFRLRQPLGSGTFARVYIAEQADLASRPVVLKISASEGTEPQTLARLQHTNIVPIYSVHEDPRAGLRAVCMPYFGGATLASVLTRLWENGRRPTRGGEWVEALDAVSAPTPEALGAAGGGEGRAGAVPLEAPAGSPTPFDRLRGYTYFQAVAWTLAQLADGLHHAHQRGIVHRDIKPSNILVDAEGVPLLLDFNVAQELAADTAHALLGGTVAYAAPEHLLALRGGTPELIRQVDHRSDLYSLGLVFAEMLTGQRLFEQGGSYSALPTQLEAMAVERSKIAPSLRQVRPDLPWSLESVARKCLDPEPQRRYQRGDQLAEDLHRFLNDLPLRHAPEPSRRERIQKFFRRNPQIRSAGKVAVAAGVLLLLAGGALRVAHGNLAEARSRLGKVGARERKRAHDSGMVRALCLVNTTLDRQDHLPQGIAVCEQTLALYGGSHGAPGPEHPDWKGLGPEERTQLAEDRRELMLLLAGARVRLAKGDPEALRGALRLLDDAEAIPGLPPSKALWLDRANYLRQLGERGEAARARRRADGIPATGPRDHYLLAISHARHGGTDGYRKAIAELDEALRQNPRHYWSAIQRGICRMELGEYTQAIGDFGACVGLWPEHSWGYYNRGCVYDRSGMKAEAVADYTAALDRDPGFAAALVNRGLARLELKGYADALRDFDEALAKGNGDMSVHAGRGIALEALGRHAEADAAFDEAFRLAPEADPARLRIRWTYAFAVSSRRPDEARAAFDEVLRHDPRHPQALYGRAMLAMAQGPSDEALRFFDRALEANAGFVAARRYRAVLLARRGDWERSARDINACLDREPTSGETLYAAACVAALAAGAAPGPRAMDQAFELLRRALPLGPDSKARARDDPDLAALRGDPRFEALTRDVAAAGGHPNAS